MPRLTASEMERLLNRNGIVHLAVVTDDGSPLVVPLGYVYRDRRILLTARERVTWLEHIRRDPRVCLSIDSPRYPLAKVTVRGEAMIVHEPGEDDEWRDLRVPLRVNEHTGPVVVQSDGSEEWMLDLGSDAGLAPVRCFVGIGQRTIIDERRMLPFRRFRCEPGRHRPFVDYFLNHPFVGENIVDTLQLERANATLAMALLTVLLNDS